MSQNPRCPNCNKPLKLSKFDMNRWICKHCNGIFEEKDVIFIENF